MNRNIMRWAGTALRRTLLVTPVVSAGIRWMSSAVSRAPAHSLLGCLSPLRTLLRPATTERQVLAILDILDEAALRYWIAGGWGIDALVGDQTRGHDDVDIILDAFEHNIHRAADALRAHGFNLQEHDRFPTWMPDRWCFQDNLNCQVELVSLDLDRVKRAFLREAPDRGGDFLPFGTGTIAGRAVPCLSPGAQRIVHGGFPARPTDHSDLALLERLPSPLPGIELGWHSPLQCPRTYGHSRLPLDPGRFA